MRDIDIGILSVRLSVRPSRSGSVSVYFLSLFQLNHDSIVISVLKHLCEIPTGSSVKWPLNKVE